MISAELESRINSDFNKQKFLQTAIFAGRSGSGKLSIALKIADKLSDSNNENILLYTTRNILSILKNAYDNFMKHMDEVSTQYFLKQANIAFLRLETSDVKQKIDKDKKDEILLALEDIKLSKNYSSQIQSNVKKIYDLLSSFKYSQSINVDDIRKINAFLHSTTATGGAKIAIIENLEDQNKAVNNALLKLLEEPPRDSLIIILSQNHHLLLKTITSRSRLYKFSTDAGEYKAKDISTENIYSASVVYTKYMLSQLTCQEAPDKIEVVKALNLAFDKSQSQLSQKEKMKLFMPFVAQNIEQYYKNGKIDIHQAKCLLKISSKINLDVNIFNQSVYNASERLMMFAKYL